ncbi:hypothetical protein LZ575_10820 [Antarcticibacterium sp. 1MA-6-2]|uniref:hypothetical protein n=1 Tax=Antarcticibacterium sp. 1MA-6-2 TaxID=2908210 RepID=UPI001F19E9DE|nr:hypothetical protein [Antarcticibacterium sp. 1MA-6-2]UJH92857.1 hypothetical protein LZ575_10820 [Antarcticibacterium sp. 1MA-6-2]
MAESLHLLRGDFLKFTLFFIGCFFFVSTGWGQTETTTITSSNMEAYAGLPTPTVTSDKADYAPGEIAIIT